MLTENKQIQCPYCGELIEIQLDATISTQSYVEDCVVCCQPIELTVHVLDDDISVIARTGSD